MGRQPQMILAVDLLDITVDIVLQRTNLNHQITSLSTSPNGCLVRGYLTHLEWGCIRIPNFLPPNLKSSQILKGPISNPKFGEFSSTKKRRYPSRKTPTGRIFDGNSCKQFFLTKKNFFFLGEWRSHSLVNHPRQKLVGEWSTASHRVRLSLFLLFINAW